MIPFTYLIGWSHLNKFYYGVRYADKCKPSDLWTIYFTSSKFVKEFRKEYGDPDVIQIRQCFYTKEKSKQWEDKVLRRINASSNIKFINQSNNNSFKNIVMTEEIKNMIGLKAVNRSNIKGKQILISDGIQQKFISINDDIPNGWYHGVSHSNKEKHKHRNHNPLKNKTKEEIEIIGKKISERLKGVPKPNGHGENVSKATKGKPKPWQQGEHNVSKRPDVRQKLRDSWKDRPSGKWYNDGSNQYWIKDGDYIDNSWKRGKLKNGGVPKGTKYVGWFNNGIKQFKFKNISDVPEGWSKGMLPRNK